MATEPVETYRARLLLARWREEARRDVARLEDAAARLAAACEALADVETEDVAACAVPMALALEREHVGAVVLRVSALRRALGLPDVVETTP
jgi:hypothetical protein